MDNSDDNWKEFYLPISHFAKVETELASRPSFQSPLIDCDEVKSRHFSEAYCINAFSCVRSFSPHLEKDTFFVLSSADIASAIVCKFEDFHCVVVTENFAECLIKISSNLLADGAVLKFLSDNTDPSEPTTGASTSRQQAVRNCAHQSVAHQPEIWDAAYLIGSYAFYFVVSHEIAHLSLGHLDKHPQMSIFETDASTEPKALLSRAMEWQADCFAAIATAYRLERLIQDNYEPFSHWFRDPAARVRFISLVCYITFTTMDVSEEDSVAYELRTHPRPMSRAGLMSYGLCTFAIASYGMNLSETMNEIRRSFWAVEITLLNLTGGVLSPEDTQGYIEEVEKSCTEFIQRLDSLKGVINYERMSNISWALMVPGMPEA